MKQGQLGVRASIVIKCMPHSLNREITFAPVSDGLASGTLAQHMQFTFYGLLITTNYRLRQQCSQCCGQLTSGSQRIN